MIVTTESGRTVRVPAHHPVYAPLEDVPAGTKIDPVTAPVAADRAGLLRRGNKIILDDTVEVVAAVAMV